MPLRQRGLGCGQALMEEGQAGQAGKDFGRRALRLWWSEVRQWAPSEFAGEGRCRFGNVVWLVGTKC